jgi:hypothetical protein
MAIGIVPGFWQKSSGFFGKLQIILACYVTAKPARAYKNRFFQKISIIFSAEFCLA